MRIQNNFINKSNIIRPAKRITQRAFSKTKSIVSEYDKKAGFMKTPIKYYLIGLAIPIPFASAVTLVVGLGIATLKKIKERMNKSKLHNA